MRLPFIYPKVLILAAVLAEEKAAKRGMVQTEWSAVISWYVKDCVQLVGCGSTGQTGKRQKVVVLRELQRAIIYTTR